MKAHATHTTYDETTHVIDQPVRIGSEDVDIFLLRVGFFQGTGRFRRGYGINRLAAHVCRENGYTVVRDGHVFEMTPGDVLFLFPGQKVLVRENQGPSRHDWFDLSGSLAKEILAEIDIVPETGIIRTGASDVLSPLLQKVQIAYTTGDYSRFFPVQCAWRIVEAISSHHSNAPTIPSSLTDGFASRM